MSFGQFDQNGMLVLPEGTQLEFRKSKRSRNIKRRTGVFIRCPDPDCGHIWERASLKGGKIRCHKCNSTIWVERLEKREA